MAIEALTLKAPLHPLDKYLRLTRIPTLWCPGCGLGVLLGCY